MKLTKSIFRICLILTLSIVTLTGCGEKKDNEKLSVNSDYIIIYPARDDVALSLAEQIQSGILDATGVSVEIKKDTELSYVPEKEIIVGNTDRKLVIDIYDGLGENEWSVSTGESKIIIAGKSNRALMDAADCFLKNHVEGKSTIEMDAGDVYSGTSKLINFSWKDGQLYNTDISGGYPRLYALKDGTMLLGYDGMYVARSIDDGLTWQDSVHASQDYEGTANAAFFQTEDGTVYLGFRSTGYLEDGSFYSSIQISCSTDNGLTWEHHSTVYENVEPTGVFKGVWEPHFGMMNGYLTCFYANDSTNITDYQNIEYKQWDPETGEWINRTIVCNGNEHWSRDGMPVWQQLSTGEYVCVIEAFNRNDNNNFAIKLTYSLDGKEWSTPVTVMSAEKSGTVCAAPYIVELPTGQLVISCQTNELDRGETYYMSTVISDGTPVQFLTEDNFSDHDYPVYDTTPAVSTMWNGMYVYKNYIYTCSISGDQGIRINRYDFSAQLQD